MARKKAKPGAVFIQVPEAPRGEAVTELSDTLRVLDPAAEQGIRRRLGPIHLFIADAGQRGEGEFWYEEASRQWQKQADTLLDHITNALEKTAPADHYFSGRRDADGTIEWGFWPRERNPEEKAEADFLYGGFRENPKPILVQRGDDDDGDVYKYRGRHILIQGAHVQVARTGGGRSGLLAEWESGQPFPHIEATQVIDLMRERAKHRHRKRANPVLGVDVLDGVRRKASKGAGALYKAGDYVIDLQPIGEGYEGEDLTDYEGMVTVTVLAPDETVLASVPIWGGRPAIVAAKKVIEKQGTAGKSKKQTKNGKRLSFMRRMMNI